MVHSSGAIIWTQVPTSDKSTHISKQNPKQMLVLVAHNMHQRNAPKRHLQ